MHACNEMIHANELQQNQHCCPKCDYHYRLSGLQRVELLADKDTFKEMFTEFKSIDPLKFVDTEPYTERLESVRKRQQGAMRRQLWGLARSMEIDSRSGRPRF